jgi:hypothetical protein
VNIQLILTVMEKSYSYSHERDLIDQDSKEEGPKQVKLQKVKQNAYLFFISILILSGASAISKSHASATPNLDEFPLDTVLEYEKVYKNMGVNPVETTSAIRFEVTNKVEGYLSRYVVVRTINPGDGEEVQTLYEDYPNGNITVHGGASLWINVTSWEGLSQVLLGQRVYNITSLTSDGCSLHYENGKDEDTIVFESHGILASGYFFHFDIDDPFSTYSFSTKLVGSNLNPTYTSDFGWLLTALLFPAIAIEVVIIGWLIKQRKKSI